MPNLTPLLWPRTIAVIGASPNTEIIRGRVLHVLRLRRFDGTIFPVTPSHEEVQGLRAYRSIAEVPEPVDLAIIVIPAAAVPGALTACGERGVRAAIIITSGFAEESGNTGRRLQDQILDIAGRYRMVVCGPNCEGVVNTMASLAATFSPALENAEIPLTPEVVRGRGIGVTSQSGGFSFAFLNRGRPRQLRFNYLISTGNEASLAGLDYVEYMLDDGQTDVFLMYVEAFQQPVRFPAVAAKAARLGKPLIIAKAGRSAAGRRAAASHTGSLAGADEIYAAMFERYGVIRSNDLDEMIDIAAAFAFCPLPGGRRVGLLSTSGGGAVWMADTLAAHGLEVPELDAETRREIAALIPSYGSAQNPVDMTAQAIREVGYARIIGILQQSPAIDAVVVIGSLASEVVIRRDIEALAAAVAKGGKPVLFCAYTLASPGALALLAGAGIPGYTSMPNCARAVRALADYAAFQEQWARRVEPPPTPAPLVAEIRDRLRAAGRVMCEYEAKALLASYRIPRPREELVESEDSAVLAAARIGHPVALKVQSPDIVHKTDAGALSLDLDGEDAVRAAYRGVLASARAAAPDADIRGVLVQQMAPAGREMIAGILRDPDFGPMLMIGLGGIHVEVLRDVVFAPVPVEREYGRQLVGQLRGAKLLDGVRGEEPADLAALVELLVNLSRFAADHAELVSEIDLNPVIVHAVGRGVSVVDALIITRRA
jgi:acyl-CoA synthetase (NDP forming)